MTFTMDFIAVRERDDNSHWAIAMAMSSAQARETPLADVSTPGQSAAVKAARSGCFVWVAIEELKLSYHNGYI